ncbi:MAG: hypothetical protein LW875_09530 [Proteobacteria bacterium]|jgi:hypothetical protein|nr:hypothetical protein [Pseudomonadota bacterium]
MKKTIALTTLLSLLTLGCGKETDADKVADAQACLDGKAGATTLTDVSDCLSKIKGINGKGAELIRCVATYVKQGKSAEGTITSLFNALDNNPGTPNQDLMAGMSAISFSAGSQTIAKSDAGAAATHCQASNSPGLSMLSTLTLTGTILLDGTDGSGGGAIDSTDVNTCISSCSAEQKALIGSAAQSAYNQNCVDSKDAPGDLCTQLGAVVGSNDPATVGNSLLICIRDRTCPGF